MQESNRPEGNAWTLHHLHESNDVGREVIVNPLPFRIGRRKDNSLCLPDGTVSKEHCELRPAEEAITAVDLGSTNGTFVNGRRVVDQTVLHRDDVLQIGDFGFRLDQRQENFDEATFIEGGAERVQQSSRLFLQQVMGGQGLTPYFQPIVTLGDSQRLVGYEILARSNVPGLEGAGDLFGTARRLSLEIKLSERCREVGGRMGADFPGAPILYLNTHPLEIGRADVIDQLARLRQENPSLRLVLEVHENALAETAVLQRLREDLIKLDIQLAYDDFGSGASRLHELSEAPPDVLKFDQCLVRGLADAPAARRAMVEKLVAMVVEQGITALAEGIETEAEAAICRLMGFTQAQGYFFGRPMPASQCRQ